MIVSNPDLDPMNAIFYKYCHLSTLQGRSAVVHLSGENAVGKTTLLLRLLNHTLTVDPTAHVYLFDTEGKFTQTRLAMLKPHHARIFRQPIATYDHLQHALRNMTTEGKIFPGSYVVIHAISTLLRHALSLSDGYLQSVDSYQLFATEILPSLVSTALKLKCHLILTHHVVWDPTYVETRPAFFDLMQNLQGMWWFLSKTPVEETVHGLKYEHQVSILTRVSKESQQKATPRQFDLFRTTFPLSL